MTKKTRSGIMTKKPRSGIGREVSAYFAPNYHLCQNYTESGSFLTVHKNIKASIHKNMECNHNDTSALVTLSSQTLVRQRITNFSNVNDN